jgi:hypothetical protein
MTNSVKGICDGYSPGVPASYGYLPGPTSSYYYTETGYFTTDASPNATNWVYIGSQTSPYNTAVDAYFDEIKCPSITTVKSWLDSNYPASNYSIGHIIRVKVFNGFPPSLCSYM